MKSRAPMGERDITIAVMIEVMNIRGPMSSIIGGMAPVVYWAGALISREIILREIFFWIMVLRVRLIVPALMILAEFRFEVRLVSIPHTAA